MYTPQDKLRDGLQILSETSDEDGSNLGMALIKIHSALEDYVRLEVGKRAPSLKEKVEDLRLTQWKDLLDYSKTYLGFTYDDARIINDANIMRQKVAHGGN